MKICLVSPFSFVRGGIQEHVLNLGVFLKKRGHKVKIIAPRSSSEDFGCFSKKDIIYVGRARYIGLNGSGGYISLGLHHEQKIKEVLAKENFDVIHFHQPDVPIISWFTLAQSLSTNVVTFHNDYEYGPFEKAIYYLLSPAIFVLNRNLHERIAVSKTAEKHVRAYFPGDYKIIPNGVDIKRFCQKGDLVKKYCDGKANILYVGRIEERKGLIYLIKAFNKAKQKNDNLRLIIVGDGTKKEECEKYVRKEKIKDVCFEGDVLFGLLPDYYRTSHVFCAPSLHGESFGIVLLEAMSSGLPVIATSIDGYKELLSNYPEKSFLVMPQDIESLKIAILKSVSDKDLAEKLGEYGRKKAVNYSWEKTTDRILETYRNGHKKRKKTEVLGSLWLKKQLMQVETSIKKVINIIDTDI